ncbi:hypothetical protein WJX84_012280 [Apatococcus fuscideae]|uniref:Uncharacterized protein n=1 Tax=Apatococcus fuscideae TaxID=2026836 RepID=A0AAW1SKD2_9CHLO
MLAPSDAPGSMQALEVAGLNKAEPKGWWQWVTARLNGSSSAGYKPLEEEVGPSDRVSAEEAARDARDRWCPEEKAGFFSTIFYSYATSLVTLGYKKTLLADDLWDMSLWDEARTISSRIHGCLENTKDPVTAPKGRLLKALWLAFGRVFMFTGIIRLVDIALQLLAPFLLEKLLLCIETQCSTKFTVGLALAMAAANMFDTTLQGFYFHLGFRISLNVKTALIDVLYRKSLRVHSATKGAMGIGAIVNLQSNDAAKLWNMPPYFHGLWTAPVQIVVIMGMLVRVIGWAPALAGFLTTCALIPVTGWLGRKLGAVRRAVVKHTDARVRTTTEVILGIKAIKLYAWEGPWTARLNELRESELWQILRSSLLQACATMLFLGGPILVSLASFTTFAALGFQLTAAVAFPALSLFNLLRFPIMQMPNQITNLINAGVGLGRIQSFLDADEMNPLPLEPPAAWGETAAEIKHGTFFWESGSEPVLRDVNLRVQTGQLVIVSGQVAYTAQDPWVRNASLRDNVLMGEKYDPIRYQEVLEACALVSDIALLPAGDSSEIGEKGINLSGGQRHRVALARACYQPADVYLLDDPLSAVDAHVGKHIFEHCIRGLLGGSTRILVTHQQQYLAAADLVVIVSQGAITASGTYEELLQQGVEFKQIQLDATPDEEPQTATHAMIEEMPTPFAQPISPPAREGDAGEMRLGSGELSTTGDGAEAGRSGSNDENRDPALIDQDKHGPSLGAGVMPLMASNKGGLVQADSEAWRLDHISIPLPDQPLRSLATAQSMARPVLKSEKRQAAMAANLEKEHPELQGQTEDRAYGSVEKSLYKTYLRAWGPWYWLPVFYLIGAASERFAQIGQNAWMSVWADATEAAGARGEKLKNTMYLIVYFSLGLGAMGLTVARAMILAYSSVRASRSLHARLLEKLMRLPMSFFDSQPTGRLLNRFARDLEMVDTSLPMSLGSFLNCVVNVVGSLLVIAFVSPAQLAALIPLGFFYEWARRLYVSTSRELKRLDSLAMSPIFGNFGETLQGLQTVRAFRRQNMFAAVNCRLLDSNNRAWWPMQVVNRWLSIRLDMLGTMVSLGTALAVTVVMPQSAGLAGLALTAALNLTGILNWSVRQSTDLEIQMNSVERIMAYTNQYDAEAPAKIPGKEPPKQWPQRGVIKVEGLVLKYRPELDPVLKGLTFTVNAREKVGVAGRTGCGKSTLMMALYRIVEPSGGRILIDGIDIASIGLFDLRSRLALVPQDPVIFSGTVRANLDPFDTAGGDAVIWQALEQAGIATAVRDLSAGLDSELTEGGGNLSTGQRQLLCMARALLRNARILVLDEATSNVDNTTDELVQSTVRSAFAHCTVLTIAHRLHTIIDSDRVLLLDAGNIKEFDTPSNLLKDKASAFSSLVQDTMRSSSFSRLPASDE